jgi:glutamate--cysteine ligase
MLKFTCCDAAGQFSGRVQAQVLQGIQRGFEKECLRVDPQGQLAQTPHPTSLGSKLTHPWITTDYSEALLEFITPPSKDPAFPLQFLRDIHRFTAPRLGDETMWASSMPCVLGDDHAIPLANYGSSNKAKFKHVYREGLGLRYGRQMQTIAGVHYNWSLPDAFWEALHGTCDSQDSLQNFTSTRYFGLIRNFLRYGWLVPYLFGASPAICRSFLRGRKSDLQELVPGTLYGPHATSLRMSDLGYQNSAQNNLHVSFNSLPEYTDALDAAIRTPDPYYQPAADRERVLRSDAPQAGRPRPARQGPAPDGRGIHRDAPVRPEPDGRHRHPARAGHLCRCDAADVPVPGQPADQRPRTGRERREQAARRHPGAPARPAPAGAQP